MAPKLSRTEGSSEEGGPARGRFCPEAGQRRGSPLNHSFPSPVGAEKIHVDKQTYRLVDAFLVFFSAKQTQAKILVQIIYLGDAGNTARGVEK